MQRYRHRQRPAQYQPLPHLEHPPCDMGVLHEDEFVALDGKFRQPVHHRKDAVMVTRRNGFEKPSPYRLRRRQDKGGRAWIGGDLPFDEIENRRVTSRLDRKTHGPWSGPRWPAPHLRRKPRAKRRRWGSRSLSLDHFQYHSMIL